MSDKTLYDFGDQVTLFKKWSREVMEEIYLQFEASSYGLIFIGESSTLPTRADNWKNSGYISFHDGYIDMPMYMNANYIEACPKNVWPIQILRQAKHIGEDQIIQAIYITTEQHDQPEPSTESEYKELLKEMQRKAKLWYEHGTNSLGRWEPNHEAAEWIKDCESALFNIEDEAGDDFMLRIEAIYAADVDRLTVRLVINMDAPYYRESIAWLAPENRQQSFDLWTTTIYYTGKELTNEFLHEAHKKIIETLWPGKVSQTP